MRQEHIHFHLSNFYGRPPRTEKKVTISRQDGGREGNISQGNGGCLKVSDWDGEGWRGTLAESNCNKGGGRRGEREREEEGEDEINPLLLGTGKEGHGRRKRKG